MTDTPVSKGFLRVLRGAWAVVGRDERLRLLLLAGYGVAIAALDAVALVLVFAVINLLNGEKVSGITASLLGAVGLNQSNRYHTALVAFAVTAVLFILRSVLSVLGLWLQAGATNAAQVGLVRRLLVGHARAPQLVRLERDVSQTFRTVLNSVAQLVFGIVGASVSLAANVAVTLAVGIGMVLASPLVALTVIVYFAAIGGAWVRLVRGSLRQRGRRVQELQQEQYQSVLQALGAAKELQLRGRALFYADAAVARQRGITSASRVVEVLNGSLRYVLETSLVVGAVLIVAVAGITGGRNAVLPAVGLVLAGAFRLLPALNQALFLSNQVQFNAAAVDWVEAELATFGPYADEPREAIDVAPLDLRAELRLEQVSFRYPTRPRAVLDGVTLELRAGEWLGVLGPIGSGKSTLLDALLGLIEPEAGSVTVDGRPMTECRVAWQRSIGYVPQAVYLVDDTLRANVALGWRDGELDQDALRDALRLARLDELIASLPEGLETRVGERGVRLSGGQRQLVGLARALYVRPSVLVLDEATSNLDHGTEARLLDTLATLRGRLTIVTVTHRISSVRECDRIVYLEAGRLHAVESIDEIEPRLAAASELDEPAVPI